MTFDIPLLLLQSLFLTPSLAKDLLVGTGEGVLASDDLLQELGKFCRVSAVIEYDRGRFRWSCDFRTKLLLLARNVMTSASCASGSGDGEPK